MTAWTIVLAGGTGYVFAMMKKDSTETDQQITAGQPTEPLGEISACIWDDGAV